MIYFPGEYEFGYEVTPDGQYHHEIKGPDGVTYGCYGYVDAFGKQVSYFYVSDGWGYRVVKPGEPVELFLHPHDPEAHHGELIVLLAVDYFIPVFRQRG